LIASRASASRMRPQHHLALRLRLEYGRHEERAKQRRAAAEQLEQAELPREPDPPASPAPDPAIFIVL
jgi:hypothetical protein